MGLKKYDGSPIMRIIGNKSCYMLEQSESLNFHKNNIFYVRKDLELANQQETSDKWVFSFSPEGSSETIRETTFDFMDFYSIISNTNGKKPRLDFLQWFIGFVEGDGSFIVSSNRLFFIITQKDIKTLYNIKKNLGFGKVSFYNGYGRFIVANRENILKLIHLFNGNLVLNKTNNRFGLWLESYNFSGNNITYKGRLNLVNFLDNSWLSGFVSAEGCFNAIVQQNSLYSIGYRFRLRFIIDQKDESLFMETLHARIKMGYIVIRKDKHNQRLVVGSYTDIDKLIKYLDIYKMYHYQKLVAYNKWKKYYNYIKLPVININKAKKLAKSINSLTKVKIESEVEDRVRP